MRIFFSFEIVSTLSALGLGMMGSAFALREMPSWISLSMYVPGAILASALPIWALCHLTMFVKRDARRYLARWEFRWPISKRPVWPRNADLAHRIYHARSNVDFESLLTESRIKVQLAFFNASDAEIEISRVSGTIAYDNIPQPRPPDTPYLIGDRADSSPLTEFCIVLEQKLSIELASQVAEYLDSGKPLSLNLTGLMIWLRPASGGKSFSAISWQGITCTKTPNAIVYRRLFFESIVENIEARQSISGL